MVTRRRRLLGLGLTLGAGTALGAACSTDGGGAGSPASLPQASPGPATIVFLTRATENHRQLFDRFAQEFQKEQPRITVRQEFVPGGTPPFLEKETTLVDSGTAAGRRLQRGHPLAGGRREGAVRGA